jgi:hypothetical protein
MLPAARDFPGCAGNDSSRAGSWAQQSDHPGTSVMASRMIRFDAQIGGTARVLGGLVHGSA